ncbi:MAG TPA: hypothetical protein PK322_12165 [Opitutaceae bacterium]|nr:hypothetical protein [Opitutaceae bacterium]
MAEKSGDVDRTGFLSWLGRAACLFVVLASTGCATTGGFVRLKPAELVGTYSAPLMVTWAHAFVLGENGHAEYDVTYDTWAEGENGELIYGESSA